MKKLEFIYDKQRRSQPTRLQADSSHTIMMQIYYFHFKSLCYDKRIFIYCGVKGHQRTKIQIIRTWTGIIGTYANWFCIDPRNIFLVQRNTFPIGLSSKFWECNPTEEIPFIVLFLFAPSVLAGGRLPNGIRAEIAGVFPDVSPCVISNNIADVSFIYQQYKDFRQDIEFIYNQVLERLKIKGVIK